MLIHRHIDTIPGSADGDAGMAFPFSMANASGEHVGIISAIGGIGSEIA